MFPHPLIPSPLGEGKKHRGEVRPARGRKSRVNCPYGVHLFLFCSHEFGGGGGTGGADAFALEDLANGHENYPDIQPEGAVVDIPDIEGEFLLPSEGVAPVDLCPTSDAGENLVAACLLGRVGVEILDEQRARTDQAHLAVVDVEELGKLIEAGGAQEAPKAGEALLIGEEVTLHITQVTHGAEFVESEDAAVQPGACLAEEYWQTEEEPDEEK